MSFALDRFATFISDSAPAAGFGGVFDPFHGREIVIIFLHSNDPVDIIEGDSFESEIYVYTN